MILFEQKMLLFFGGVFFLIFWFLLWRMIQFDDYVLFDATNVRPTHYDR